MLLNAILKARYYLREDVLNLIIVLDTNIFCRDFYAKGTQLQLLLKMGNIIVPEIVVDETLNKHKEKLRESGNAVLKKLEEYNRLTYNQITIDFDACYADEDDRYEKFLTNLLLEHAAYPPQGYPDISHKEVVDRALLRKKPFKPDGREGYRDYLVWRTMLEVVKRCAEPIHFISENPKDFADENDKKKLHPDLLEEMQQLQIESTQLTYWCSLKDFVDKVVKPELKKLDDEQRLKQDLMKNVQFMKSVSGYLDEHLNGFDVRAYDVFVPGEKPVIESFEEGFESDIQEVSRIENDKILVTMRCNYMSVVQSEISKAEATSLPQECLADSIIEEISGNVLAVHTEVPIDVLLEIIFDMGTATVDTVEITDVSDSTYCEYCPYD